MVFVTFGFIPLVFRGGEENPAVHRCNSCRQFNFCGHKVAIYARCFPAGTLYCSHVSFSLWQVGDIPIFGCYVLCVKYGGKLLHFIFFFSSFRLGTLSSDHCGRPEFRNRVESSLKPTNIPLAFSEETWHPFYFIYDPHSPVALTLL